MSYGITHIQTKAYHGWYQVILTEQLHGNGLGLQTPVIQK